MTADGLTPEQREAIEFIAQRAIDGYRDGLRAKVEALPGAALSGDARGVVYRDAVLALLDGGIS